MLFVLCVSFAWGQEPGGGATPADLDAIDFTGGTPKAGANKGEIATTVEWKGSQIGLDKAEIALYLTDGGKEKLLSSKDNKVTKTPGTWAYQFTGLTSGKVVTRAYCRTIDVSSNTIAEKSLPNLTVTVP